jgi:hypothetical protein
VWASDRNEPCKKCTVGECLDSRGAMLPLNRSNISIDVYNKPALYDVSVKIIDIYLVKTSQDFDAIVLLEITEQGCLRTEWISYNYI